MNDRTINGGDNEGGNFQLHSPNILHFQPLPLLHSVVMFCIVSLHCHMITCQTLLLLQEMVGLLDKFINEKDTKLRDFEQRLRESQAQVSKLTSEKVSKHCFIFEMISVGKVGQSCGVKLYIHCWRTRLKGDLKEEEVRGGT